MPYSPRHRPQQATGFTLVELTVATTVMTVLLLGVYGVFYQSMDVEVRTAVRWQERAEAASLADHLAETIARSVNLPGLPTLQAAPGDEPGVFTLTTTTMAEASHSGLRPVMERRRYHCRPVAEGGALEVTLQRMPYAGTVSTAALSGDTEYLAEEELWVAVPAERIAENLAGISVRFQPIGQPDAQWLDRWAGPASGVLVHIRVQVGEQLVERYVVAQTTGSLVEESG